MAIMAGEMTIATKTMIVAITVAVMIIVTTIMAIAGTEFCSHKKDRVTDCVKPLAV